MELVEVKLQIAAPADEVWATVLDVERYAEMMDQVRSVTIVESPNPSERVTAWSVFLKGSILEWTEKESIDRRLYRIDFTQVDGDLAELIGYWLLTPIDSECTQAELAVEFDIGIPLLADMLNPVAARALRDNSLHMLREIDLRVTHPSGAGLPLR